MKDEKKISPPKALRKLKSVRLTRNKQLEIAVYKKKHPHLSYYLIADQFNVAYDQVSYACKKYKAGLLTVCKPSSQKGKLKLARQIAESPSIWNEHAAPVMLRAMADVA